MYTGYWVGSNHHLMSHGKRGKYGANYLNFFLTIILLKNVRKCKSQKLIRISKNSRRFSVLYLLNYYQKS